MPLQQNLMLVAVRNHMQPTPDLVDASITRRLQSSRKLLDTDRRAEALQQLGVVWSDTHASHQHAAPRSSTVCDAVAAIGR